MSKLKKLFFVVAILLVVIQFFPAQKNIASGAQLNSISGAFVTSAEVQNILALSCNDCHSNNTVYPWYNNIQPVAWWLKHHIDEGKRELNFDEFVTYKPRKQYHKLQELEEMVSEAKMPLPSYLWVHKEAALNEQQKDVLIKWSKAIRDELETQYPKDSLIIKKQKP